jgi:hypothetical protein
LAARLTAGTPPSAPEMRTTAAKCRFIIVDVSEGLHMMLMGLIDDGSGDLRPQIFLFTAG